MNKLLNILFAFTFIAFVQADDHKSFGVQYADWDIGGLGASSVDLGYSAQNDNMIFSFGILRADPDFGSGATIWSSGVDFATGDWEVGTPFFGLSYSDSNVSDVDGVVGYEIGYARSASSGTNYSFSFTSCNDDCDTSTNLGFSWDIGNGNNIGLSYSVEDDNDTLGLGYIKKW